MVDPQTDLTTLTVQLLSAYVSNNSVPSNELAALIETTRTALAPRTPEMEAAVSEQAEHVPAVSIRKSRGSRDHILSMIDGRPYKSLKRHLSRHGLTPADYRERYGLPKDYPMVAPGYSEARREVAHRLGLGRKPAANGTLTDAALEPEADPAPASAELAEASEPAPPAAEADAAPKTERTPTKAATSASTTAGSKTALAAKRGREPASDDASE